MKSNVAEVEKDLGSVRRHENHHTPAPSLEQKNAALSATTHSQVIDSTPTLPICVVTTTDEKAHEKPDLQAQVRQKVTDRDQKGLKKAINNLKASAGPKGKKSEDTTDVGYQQEIASLLAQWIVDSGKHPDESTPHIIRLLSMR